MLGSLDPLPGAQLLTDQAYQRIKKAILSLSLSPEQPLVETAIAQQLGVSKTPVRDALRRLEKEGLVVFYPYKGFYVAPISREDVREVYQLRGVLEGFAARVAAQSMSQDDLQALEQLLRQAEEALAQSKEAQCRELGKQFHRALVHAVRNRRLEAILGNLSDHEERFYNLLFGIPGRLQRSLAEHWEIFRLIQMGDGHKAEAAVHAHVDSFLRDFLADENVKRLTKP
ncbi:MAG: GntR family transcriptional regulator [Bacillota bacterium]